MALNQHNLPVMLKSEISHLLSELCSEQDRLESGFGLLVFPHNTRQFRSFYACYMEFVPVFQREWALSLILTGTVNKRCWHLWHVLGCVKDAPLPPLTALGGIHRGDFEHRLMDWQQHLLWLLERTTMNTHVCQPNGLASLLKAENIWVNMPRLIGGKGTEHLHDILAPVTSVPR